MKYLFKKKAPAPLLGGFLKFSGAVFFGLDVWLYRANPDQITHFLDTTL